MKISFQICLITCVLALAALAQSPSLSLSLPKAPDTPKHPVTDEYHGVKVTDDYRWLENWDDPQVKQWSSEENVAQLGHIWTAFRRGRKSRSGCDL